jgi:hypothetical protein
MRRETQSDLKRIIGRALREVGTYLEREKRAVRRTAGRKASGRRMMRKGREIASRARRSAVMRSRGALRKARRTTRRVARVAKRRARR